MTATATATTQNLDALIGRAGWATRRNASGRGHGQRHLWTRADINRLHDLVGKRSVSAIAREMGRSRNSVASKLQMLGYRIKADVNRPIGINCYELAERIGMSYEQVWRDCRAGVIKGTAKEHKKDYLIPWRSVRAYERRIADVRARRQRVLGRIRVETITKQQAMALIGLSETHMTRYLQGKVVKAWKVPLMWVPGNRQRWEWLISKADAERVKHLRAAGKLHVRLRKQAFRKIAAIANEEVKQLKRERRAGLRQASMKPFGPRAQAVVPGYLTVAQVAQRVGLSGACVYGHVRNGRLQATSVRAGQRTFLAVSPEALAAYEAWCARPVKATGPMQGWRKGIERMHALGLITAREAAEQFDIKRGTLALATWHGRIKARKVGALLAYKPADVARYKAGMRSRPRPRPRSKH